MTYETQEIIEEKTIENSEKEITNETSETHSAEEIKMLDSNNKNMTLPPEVETIRKELEKLRQERAKYKPGSPEYRQISNRIYRLKKRLEKKGWLHIIGEEIKHYKTTCPGPDKCQIVIQLKKQIEELQSKLKELEKK